MKAEIETTRDGKWLKIKPFETWRNLNISELNPDDIRAIIKLLQKELGPEGKRLDYNKGIMDK